jgi:hypothetical protein
MRALEMALAASTPGQGWVGDWSPGIGDPTITGWVTVVSYFVGAYLCWLAFKVERVRRGLPGAGLGAFFSGLGGLLRGMRSVGRPVPVIERVPALWAGLSLMLFLLGLNKQLDLQTLFTDIGRLMAKDEGWYADRRFFQFIFIVALVLVGGVAMRALWRFARGHLQELRLALLGALGLTCFVAIRAASFHHFDIFIGSEVAGLTFNAILEIGAISLIVAGAAHQIFGSNQPVPVPRESRKPAPRPAAKVETTRITAQVIYTPPPRPPARKR